MNIKIQLTTLSPLISASGESSAHIDADVKYDEYGFPYIQARTFKGVLRESAIEVCEIMGYDLSKIDALFGNEGDAHYKRGALQFNNLYIADYEDIAKELATNSGYLRPSFVKEHYTEYRRQTTIDSDKGTARDKSLRTYRLISEGNIFESVIENVPPEEKDFFEKTLANLRYMGSRRNRGFGKIKIESKGEAALKEAENQIATSGESLYFSIETLDTLLISKVVGEQNTVNTEHFIPAQSIRGLLAKLVIDKEGKDKAHQNSLFKQLILGGDVKYHHAFFKGAQPVPRILGFDKTKAKEEETDVTNILKSSDALKSLGGFIMKKDNKLWNEEVKTSFSFHSSRHKNRLAGRSTEEGGAIFYYEAIEKGQTFLGKIEGSAQDLAEIHSLLSQNGGQHRMGKSKTAQYSKVKFNFQTEAQEARNLAALCQKGSLYLVFQTPVITYNSFGMAIPDMNLVKEDLSRLGLKIAENGFRKMSALTLNEAYMGIWNCKTPREAAFDIGTTLEIQPDTNISEEILIKALANIEYEGLGERKSEGFGRVKWVDLNGTFKKIKTPENPPEPKLVKHEVLLKLRTEQDEKDKLNRILAKATENASSAKNITNSLISRLREKLDAVARIEEWQKFITDIKGKKAGANLDNANLYDKILGLKSPDECNNNFKLQKAYWLTYFKTLRAKSNLKERNGK